MKRTVLKLLLWMNLLFAVIVSLSGCATTKPNTPFAGPYPQCFNELSAKNPLLANELGKLPEVQDGISELEETALDHFVRIYNHNAKSFNKAFQEMYPAGKPNVRKYCTPLQAMYWLLLDNKIKIFNQTVQKYDLKLLLDKSWGQGIKGDYLELSSEKVHEIAKSINGKEETYVPNNVSTDVLKKIIIYHYFENPRIFTKNHKTFMINALNNEFNNRWNNFDTVVDRLNSPELVDYWINSNIVYKYFKGNTRSATSVFKSKIGDCDDLANFGRVALSRGGYSVFGRRVYNGPDDAHIGLATKLEDGSYSLLIDFSRGGNTKRGPFKTLKEVDSALGYGNRYFGREYCTFH